MCTDPLTGVSSYVTLEKRIHPEVERSFDDDLRFSITLLNLEPLENASEVAGSQSCNQVLAQFASRSGVMGITGPI